MTDYYMKQKENRSVWVDTSFEKLCRTFENMIIKIQKNDEKYIRLEKSFKQLRQDFEIFKKEMKND